MEIPTIRAQHPTVPGRTMLINKSDFDSAVHKLPGEAVPVDSESGAELLGEQEGGEQETVVEEEVVKLKAARKRGR